RSGVVSSSLPPGDRTSASTSRRCFTVSVESTLHAVTPLAVILSSWSLISAISGLTTTVTPGTTSDVSWYSSDLPLPVGITASRSSLRSRCASASAWPGRNALMPSACCPTPSSAPTFLGRPSASGGIGPSSVYAGRGPEGVLAAAGLAFPRVFFTGCSGVLRDTRSGGSRLAVRAAARDGSAARRVARLGAAPARPAPEDAERDPEREAGSFFLVVRGRFVVDIQCPSSLSPPTQQAAIGGGTPGTSQSSPGSRAPGVNPPRDVSRVF